MNETPVYSYIRPEDDVEGFPDSLYGDMSVIPSFRSEIQWLYYLMLKDDLDDIHICRDYPKQGILYIHKGNVDRFVWNPNLYVVSMQWDYARDDRGQMHLVSNNYQTTNSSLGWLDRLSFGGKKCVGPPVLHPIIKPRSSERGDLFENIAFMGEPKNLDDAFKSEYFTNELNRLGLKFLIITDPSMHPDYTQIDAVLAVRKIGTIIRNKPAAKLINAWRAGVPAIVGCELGYRDLGKDECDFIEVDSVDEVIGAFKRLKQDLDYRNRMMANAKRRGEAYTAEEQKKSMVRFVTEILIPSYMDWQEKSVLSKYSFLIVRWIRWQLRLMISFVGRRVLKWKSRHYH